MCTGAEMLMLGATAMSANAQMQRGEDLAQQGREREQAGNFMAEQARADAIAEREAAEVKAQKVRKAGAATQSSAKASLAASGVVATAGTAVKIQETIGRRSDEDALNEILYGERKAERLEQDADLAKLSGQRARAAGERGQAASNMAAFGSLFEGGSKVAGGWKTSAKRPTGGSYMLATGGERV